MSEISVAEVNISGAILVDDGNGSVDAGIVWVDADERGDSVDEEEAP